MVSSYFQHSQWTKHNDLVFEAQGFVDTLERDQIIEAIDRDIISQDIVTWDAAEVTPRHDLHRVVHKMHDGANRYAMQEMRLVKVMAHRYRPGASSPPHADVFPIATLLYLNDDYEGGEIFFESGLVLKPDAGSLLVFDGGKSNIHGVSKIEGSNNRYVLVAFWEYQTYENQVRFWNDENGHRASKLENLVGEIEIEYHTEADILYKETFPILKVNNFVTPELAKSLVRYMQANIIEGDECYGAPCFKEYYEKEYEKAPEPSLVEGITASTLSDINEKIGALVNRFYNDENKEKLVFSKFKGHGHVEASASPPHTHDPGVVLAVLVLNDDYSGGETVIPRHDISLKHEPYALYIFSEENELNHGVSLVEKGTRVSLISHWQLESSTYNNAGANI